MATLTYNIATPAAATGAKAARFLDVGSAVGEKRGFFSRLVAAIQASRMRKAEIEIRRYKALMADIDPGFKDALLPFRGE